jgi:predicted enzyme related to lactoylglutathione lyase
MPAPVVHVEVIGPDPARLRRFYAELFGWDAPAGAPVAPEVSGPADYAFNPPGNRASAVPAGIGGGDGFAAGVLFYVGVPDVERALAEAERLGGRRLLGPVVNTGGGVVVGHLADPAGNRVGVAAPA